MSARSDAALAAVPAGPRVVRVYLRHCFIPAVGNPDPLWVNPAVDSRWWTPRGSLYVAEEPDTVMAEHCRNSAAGVQAADPTGGVGLNERNFGYYAGQPVGDPLPARAQSAANPDGAALAILHDAFPAPERWHIEAAATRPSVRTAYLTRYREGERPAWLAAAP